MQHPRNELIGKLEAAQSHIEDALKDLRRTPSPDLGAIQFTTHAMASYLNLVEGVTVLLRQEFREYPVAAVQSGLDFLERSSALMGEALEELQAGSFSFRPEIVREEVVMGKYAGRFCELYRRKASPKNVRISYDVLAATSSVCTDRVLAGVVLDSLMAEALRHVREGSAIPVVVEETLDSVQVRIGPLEEARDDAPSAGIEVALETADRIGATIGTLPGEAGAGYVFSIPKRVAEIPVETPPAPLER